MNKVKKLKINRVVFLITGIIFAFLGFVAVPFLLVGAILLFLAYKTNKAYKEALEKEEKPKMPMTKEEKKKQRKEAKEQRQEKRAVYWGCSLQTIGKIPMNSGCKLTLNSEEKVLNINHKKIDITLPYDRVKGFRVEDEVTLKKAGSGVGGAVLGGALFGGAGAIVGQNLKKGATKVKWIATLYYVDKDGVDQELHFVESRIEGDSKSLSAISFENAVNNIASKHGEDIAEL